MFAARCQRQRRKMDDPFLWEINERFCAQQPQSGISFPSNTISCVWFRGSLRLSRDPGRTFWLSSSGPESCWTETLSSQMPRLSNNTFFPLTVLCHAGAPSSLIPPGCCCLSLFLTNARPTPLAGSPVWSLWWISPPGCFDFFFSP